MMLTLNQSISIKPDVLVQELQGEIVLLNLESEEYFGLDDVGSQMWLTLKDTGSIQVAFDRLLEQYDVEPAQLQADFLELIEKWLHHELLEIVAA
jgi:Coenzyme PQQ synthesis protein D (PqqD)